MTQKPETPEEYIEQLPEDRIAAVTRLRKTVLDNLPNGFVETMSYGTIGYVVPHSIYPDGYHCDPKQPLPFMGIGSTKGHTAFHHMGIYADQELLDWFVSQYPNHSKAKLNMGKSCIRFKNPEKIPFELIAELVRKLSPGDWIEIYESAVKRS